MPNRRFDDVSVVKENSSEATIQCRQRDFDAKQHTASANVSGNTLTVTATIGDKTYQKVISDVDIQDAVKVTKESKNVIVKVTKSSDFQMAKKI